MSAVDVLGSQPGRVLRVVAGLGILSWAWRQQGGRRIAGTAAGLVPLTAGAADLCLLGPLVGRPLPGKAFRQSR